MNFIGKIVGFVISIILFFKNVIFYIFYFFVFLIGFILSIIKYFFIRGCAFLLLWGISSLIFAQFGITIPRVIIYGIGIAGAAIIVIYTIGSAIMTGGSSLLGSNSDSNTKNVEVHYTKSGREYWVDDAGHVKR